MGGKAKIDFYGSSEILKKIEKAGGNVEKCIVEALKKSAEKPKQEMISFLRDKPHPYSTGATLDSFTEEIKQEGNEVYMKVGFDIKKGGIPALFLNLGTPRVAPSWFIDNAVEHNIDEIKKAQVEALNKAFRELL